MSPTSQPSEPVSRFLEEISCDLDETLQVLRMLARTVNLLDCSDHDADQDLEPAFRLLIRHIDTLADRLVARARVERDPKVPGAKEGSRTLTVLPTGT